MRRRDFLCSVGLAWVAANVASAGQLPAEFVNLYRPASERMVQAYSQLTVDGTLRMELPQQEKSSEQEFIMRANGNKRRLDLRTIAQKGMGLKIGATEMSMATPYGSLNTYTNPNSSFFDDAQQRKYSTVVADIDRRSLVTYPYAMGGQTTILAMLLSPSVKIDSVRWIRDRGEAMVQIDYLEVGKHAGENGRWKSSLVLSPSDGWGLRSFTRTLTDGSSRLSQRGQIQYGGMEEGVPLLQAIEIETTERNRVLRREGATIKRIDLGAPNPEYFDSWTF